MRKRKISRFKPVFVLGQKLRLRQENGTDGLQWGKSGRNIPVYLAIIIMNM